MFAEAPIALSPSPAPSGRGRGPAREGREGEGAGRARAILSVMAKRKARRLQITLTDAERRLWSALRARPLKGYKFRRQHPLGPFIVDIACLEHRLVVEADGGQHADSDDDRRRTAWLERRGWRVVRFWNNDILANPAGAEEVVLRELEGHARGARARRR
jgi:very-short-patch-repair endonuclease